MFATQKTVKDWKKAAQEVERLVDGLGRHVDPGVKETVITLRALGINTWASCEGHLDHGIPGPWIDIQHHTTWNLEKRRQDFLKRNWIAKSYTLLKKIRKQNTQEVSKVIPYLHTFYKRRKTPFDQRLVLRLFMLESVRLESQGAELFQLPGAKKKNLKKYQKEMKDFGGFLKKKYFK